MSLLEVGQIMRAHSLRGEVVVQLVTNRIERLSVGWTPATRAAASRGARAPREVGAARPFQRRYLVHFRGIDSRELAESLRGVTLLAEADDAGDHELYVHELIGKRVLDQHGIDRGMVTSVEANPASDLLVLQSGALVPLRFVADVGAATISVEVPEGLFE